MPVAADAPAPAAAAEPEPRDPPVVVPPAVGAGGAEIMVIQEFTKMIIALRCIWVTGKLNNLKSLKEV